MSCPHCGSENIEQGIRLHQNGDGTKFGLCFGNFMIHTAQVYCDLCNDCGTIVRFYIKEDPKTIDNWIKH